MLDNDEGGKHIIIIMTAVLVWLRHLGKLCIIYQDERVIKRYQMQAVRNWSYWRINLTQIYLKPTEIEHKIT